MCAHENETQDGEEVARQKIRGVMECLQQGTDMEQIFILTPRDRRSTVFFWLGVGVFPIFWSWFTFERKFASWQRCLALGWMVTTLVAFALASPQMSERYKALLLGLPLVSLLVTLGLCLWLAIRTFSFVDWFLFCVVAGGVAPLLLSRLMTQAMEQDFSCKWAALPFAPALLHLVTSVAKTQQRLPEGGSEG
ncbi:hypothetical protein [Roseimicrobium sp. ORNL1]|uniref:hypothetical protein n=1 Tax=Roseimicrobium sp. ORNL1 TaxID=2711231 RepID=UPI0013E1417D|nr:hypothetical protein [Roseimicrobium sp. ORNL1]QIF02602.1 hypothetical protein G5S37_14065 [Roseimicrobium sp. ORNL1]